MDRVVVQFSLMMWTVLVLNLPLEIAHIMDGELKIVTILKMPVQSVLPQMVIYIRM